MEYASSQTICMIVDAIQCFGHQERIRARFRICLCQLSNLVHVNTDTIILKSALGRMGSDRPPPDR